MKIAILGLVEYENLGDQFIGKTVDYLVTQYGKVETKLLDFSLDVNVGVPFALKVAHKIARILNWNQASDYFLTKKYKHFYSRTLFKHISMCDAIIFSGGSFKYGTQDVWIQYSVIIDYADKHNIPVMFDAMNVQKFDGSNYKCVYLKEHLNRPCVKYFTSRDGKAGVERLKKDYVENSALIILPAADPAFWIPETYGVIRNKSSNLIGINVIAPNRFILYGGSLTPQEVKKAYIEMLQKLTEKGFSWQLFTNGMVEDNDFANELDECCGLGRDSIVIPRSDVELATMEANYMAVFGARLHSMICAYSLGVPVAGFVWDEKITHFAEMAKLEDLFLKENEITGDAMFESLMKALQRDDDSENRNYWKNTTKETICKFLDTLKVK